MLTEQFTATIYKGDGTSYGLGPFPLYEQARQEILSESEEPGFQFAEINKVFIKKEVN